MLFARDYGSRLLGGYLGENGPLLPQLPRKPLHHIILIDRGQVVFDVLGSIKEKKNPRHTVSLLLVIISSEYCIQLILILTEYNISIRSILISMKKVPLCDIFIFLEYFIF